jgi:hypothetical protein
MTTGPPFANPNARAESGDVLKLPIEKFWIADLKCFSRRRREGRGLDGIARLQRQQEIFRLAHLDLTPQPMPAWTPEKDTERHAAF